MSGIEKSFQNTIPKVKDMISDREEAKKLNPCYRNLMEQFLIFLDGVIMDIIENISCYLSQSKVTVIWSKIPIDSLVPGKFK